MIIGQKVFESNRRTKMEYFNECSLMLTVYTVTCFTPFIPEAPTQFLTGYATIFFVLVQLVINLFVIFKSTYKFAKFKLLLCLRKKQLAKQRLKTKLRLSQTHTIRKARYLRQIEEAASG